MNIRIFSAYSLFLSAALCLGAAMKAEQSKTSDKKQWNQKNAITAFNMALTRAGYDRLFRDRLAASPDSAKQAVAEEGQIIVPENILIMLHEDKFDRNYHVFSLPPWDENAHSTHEYKKHLECCYQPWLAPAEAPQQSDPAKTNGLKEWNQTNAAGAFTASLTRSAYDKVFRDRLTASLDSAKQAVSEEGQIAVPDEVVILFHENKSNENYHIFNLPRFDENARTRHEYRQYFECCYPVW